MPKRIQLRRTKGWRIPENTVKVSRPGVWGNPFIHADAAEAVAAYRRLLEGGTQSFEMGPDKLRFAANLHPQTTHWNFATWARESIDQLRGKDLACWCPLDQPCHADVLLDLANAPIKEGWE